MAEATTSAAAAGAAATPADAGDDILGVMNVTKEDQDKINRFAKLNARHEDLKVEISAKTNELKNYEDAVAEAELKVLEDEGDKLHLQAGDILVNLAPEKTQEWLEDKMKAIKETLEELDKKKAEISSEMNELKALLYAKFGNNIHLESGP